MDEILNQIKEERARQDGMWGTAFDDKNTVNDWSTYICRYATDAAWAHPTKRREQLVKAAALAVAAIEAIDRNGDCAPRHYDEVSQ